MSETELPDEKAFLDRYVNFALWLLAAIVVIATITGLVESFDGLYNWFSTHGTTGVWADFAPLMLDSFTVLGELAIFAGISRRWKARYRILPWLSIIIGIATSVAGNVGDKSGHPITWMLTAAVPPLAGAFGITIGLGVLKRVAHDVAVKAHLRKAEAVMISTEGLKELEDEKFEAPLLPLEAPKPQPFGLDALIPPREASSWEGIVQPSTGPMQEVPDVPDSEANEHQRAHPRRDNGLIHTDSFPAVS